jgi:hypothetical protein
MTTTRNDINQMLDKLYAVRSPFTHMVVFIDTFEAPGESGGWAEYFKSADDAKKRILEAGDFTRAMECYNRNMDREEQLAQGRAWNLD